MKLTYKNTAVLMKPHAHGSAFKKKLIVLHETVSKDIPGWQDIDSVEAFLANKDYGIHGMTDAEGHIAWAFGLGKAIFWQAGGVNYESIGIENVSNVMMRSPSNVVRKAIWLARNKQLVAMAKLVASICNTQNIPCRLAKWDPWKQEFTPGVLSHWDVSQHYAASDGHSDCWPVHKGGYFPMIYVVTLAQGFQKLGYTL